jgi:hypothetical protein
MPGSLIYTKFDQSWKNSLRREIEPTTNTHNRSDPPVAKKCSDLLFPKKTIHRGLSCKIRNATAEADARLNKAAWGAGSEWDGARSEVWWVRIAEEGARTPRWGEWSGDGDERGVAMAMREERRWWGRIGGRQGGSAVANTAVGELPPQLASWRPTLNKSPVEGHINEYQKIPPHDTWEWLGWVEKWINYMYFPYSFANINIIAIHHAISILLHKKRIENNQFLPQAQAPH